MQIRYHSMQLCCCVHVVPVSRKGCALCSVSLRMPRIWVGRDSYTLKGPEEHRADHVRLADGSTRTFKMRNGETLQDFEKRVREAAAAAPVSR